MEGECVPTSRLPLRGRIGIMCCSDRKIGAASRRVVLGEGELRVDGAGMFSVDAAADVARPASRVLRRTGVAGGSQGAQTSPPAECACIRFNLVPHVAGAQSIGYASRPQALRPKRRIARVSFMRAVTLAQLVALSGGALPVCEIEDAPDFEARGVMLDISRDKVPTMATLFELVDRLAALKINQLQLYTEHTFAYRGHEEVWRDASPMTPEEIRELDVYCLERCVELVPNQNSFGHLERWLALPRYAPLAELPQGGAPLPWGGIHERPTSLCPRPAQPRPA